MWGDGHEVTEAGRRYLRKRWSDPNAPTTTEVYTSFADVRAFPRGAAVEVILRPEVLQAV